MNDGHCRQCRVEWISLHPQYFHLLFPSGCSRVKLRYPIYGLLCALLWSTLAPNRIATELCERMLSQQRVTTSQLETMNHEVWWLTKAAQKALRQPVMMRFTCRAQSKFFDDLRLT